MSEDLSESDIMPRHNVTSKRGFLRCLDLSDTSTIDLDQESLESTRLSEDFGSPSTPKSRRKFRKSPLPPSRPRSLRILAREEKLKSPPAHADLSQSTIFPQSKDKKSIRALSMGRRSEVSRTDIASNQNSLRDYLDCGTLRSSRRDAAGDVPRPPHLVEQSKLKKIVNRSKIEIMGEKSGSINPQICISCGDWFVTNNDAAMKSSYRRPATTASSFSSIFRATKNICATVCIMLYAVWEGSQKDECCKKSISKVIFGGVVIILIVNVFHLLFFEKDNQER